MIESRTTDAEFYRKWIVANGWAEAAGLGGTFAIGGVLASSIDRVASTSAILAGALVAIALGTLLEGVVVGAAQAGVLHHRLYSLPRRAWVTASAIGAGLAWTIGLLPSTVMALTGHDAGAASAPVEPSPLVKYLLAAALGAVTGPILGLAQWTVLRHRVRHAARWLAANAGAWAVGMVLVFSGMDVVPWTLGPIAVVPSIGLVCLATGLAVGAIHGRTLLWLTRLTEPPVFSPG